MSSAASINPRRIPEQLRADYDLDATLSTINSESDRGTPSEGGEVEENSGQPELSFSEVVNQVHALHVKNETLERQLLNATKSIHEVVPLIPTLVA